MANRKDKLKRLMNNFVGATASVAVVATVASFSISVEAYFLDVTVFQNRAFYQLEVNEIVEIVGSGDVPEDTPEPINTPVRLRVQNQWDDFFLPLIYGYNEGFIEPLRPNQQYTLTIELQQTVGWSTLDSYLFDTEPTNAAVISEVIETTSPLNPLSQLSVSVLTQNGGTPPDAWTLVLNYGDTLIEQPLNVGENVINFENLSHVNAPIELEVFAVLPEETKSMTRRVYEATEFVDGEIEIRFPTLTKLQVETTKATTLPNASYDVRLTTEGQVSRTFEASNDSINLDDLVQGETYFFEWILTYQTNVNSFKEVVLFAQNIIPILTPIYVVSIYPQEIGQRLEVTIDTDLSIESLSIQGEQDGMPFDLPLALIQETPAALTYRLDTEMVFEDGITFALILIQPAPFDYPITLQNIVFQQGGTIV